jgi:hypothetical protein
MKNKQLFIWSFSGLLFFFAILVLRVPVISQGHDWDPGVYAYVAKRLLQGQELYTEIWDHKGPIMFFMNAIGLQISGLRYEGIILFQGILLLATSLFSFRYLSFYFGFTFGIVATLFLLFGLTLQSGNFPSEYNLFYQSLSMLFFCRSFRGRCSEREHATLFVAIGALAALSFFTRQNMIALWFVIGLYLLFKISTDRDKQKQSLVALASMTIGFALVAVTVLLFMSNQWSEYLEATWSFNFNSTGSGRWWEQSLRQPLGNLIFWIPLSWFAIVAFPIVVVRFLCYSGPFNPLSLVLLWAPLELFLASINRQYHGHYNLQMLLPMQIVIACFLHTLFTTATHAFAAIKTQASTEKGARKSRRLKIGAVSFKMVASIVIILVVFDLMREPDAVGPGATFKPLPVNRLQLSAEKLLHQQQNLFKFRPFVKSSRPIIPYIEKTLSPDETLLFLGDSGYVHFFSDRHPPTSQFYFYHIDAAGEELGRKYAGELLEAAENASADMIVLDIGMWRNTILLNHPEIKEKFEDAVNENYVLDHEFWNARAYLKID